MSHDALGKANGALRSTAPACRAPGRHADNAGAAHHPALGRAHLEFAHGRIRL